MPDSVLRVLTCGSVDAGKSTLIGRLLFECGDLPDEALAALERESERFGTVDGGVDYALLVDNLEAEREQRVTIDVAYRFFETPRRRFILADAPGHGQYTRNMVTGASNSDLAILLVDACNGLLDQTRRHAMIASLLGIRSVVLAVNKMDLVGFDRARFDEIVADFATLKHHLGEPALSAIPVCARDGDNIVTLSQRMPWYRGAPLISELEKALPPSHASDRPARFPVQYVNRPNPSFRGYTGTISLGRLSIGDTVMNATSRVEAKVARIVTMDGDIQSASGGQPVTLVLDRDIDVSRGDVLAAQPGLQAADQIAAWVVWMDETPLFRGRAYQLMLGTKSVVATVSDISARLDMETLEEESVRELGLNEIGRVSIALSHPVACEPYGENRDLGGFILVDRMTQTTVGAGMVTDLASGRANVPWHRFGVDKSARAALKHQMPAVLWFTGLSGAGKSTIANLVEEQLLLLDHHTMILDGDNVRHGLNRDLGFSEADRVENVRRIAEVAKLFVDAGIIVLVSFISPYRNERGLARECVEDGEFIEIFVDTPIEECSRRDPKGLYRKAYAGELRNFTGVDAPYEEPLAPEIRLSTLGQTPETLCAQVIEDLRARGIIGRRAWRAGATPGERKPNPMRPPATDGRRQHSVQNLA